MWSPDPQPPVSRQRLAMHAALPRRLPNKQRLEYTKLLLEVLLLVLALPWLLYRLATNPRELIKGIGHHHEH